MKSMNELTEKLLQSITGFSGAFRGAFHIRENGRCAAMRSSANIRIEEKPDASGLTITVLPGTTDETVYIPACVTSTGMNDQVTNDFFIGAGADVVIVAGCGVHSEGSSPTRHSGVHRFILEENAHVRYEEKHIGTGDADGERVIDPVTDIVLKENAFMEMDTTQISGIRRASRSTTATAAARAKLVVRERLFTDGDQQAESSFQVSLDGTGASADIISRSVARGSSYQNFESTIVGNACCTGHSECDAIIDGEAVVDASPRLFARNRDAAMIHEAAIGRIAGEQIMKFRTLGLTEEEAEAKIIAGFLA